jgi:hypothetical protein
MEPAQKVPMPIPTRRNPTSRFVIRIPSCSLRESNEKLRQSGGTYSILILEMTKGKPGKFSATKAIKANARERVGQPKPARVVDDTPRNGRGVKHKPTLEKILRQEE